MRYSPNMAHGQIWKWATLVFFWYLPVKGQNSLNVINICASLQMRFFTNVRSGVKKIKKYRFAPFSTSTKNIKNLLNFQIWKSDCFSDCHQQVKILILIIHMKCEARVRFSSKILPIFLTTQKYSMWYILHKGYM